jgi:hypothetical protein
MGKAHPGKVADRFLTPLRSLCVSEWSAPVQVTLERGRLRRFAEAVGERDPRYVDVEHARSLGYPDLPVPLTYLFTLESEGEDTLAFMDRLGVDPLAVLHGEQHFEYPLPLYAGQVVELRHSVVEDYKKQDKPLRIIVRRSEVSLGDQLACLLTATWVVRLR